LGWLLACFLIEKRKKKRSYPIPKASTIVTVKTVKPQEEGNQKKRKKIKKIKIKTKKQREGFRGTTPPNN
jgi:hypothetical protein